ncbi:MAG TPA: tRNA (adenosine(37)-N6)-threonylcarbamoyltransferase complex ATPase subunit type 1 TsaE [Candidatus Polarisedimenticolia bacterium]
MTAVRARGTETRDEQVETDSAEATARAGRLLAARLGPGDVVVLSGPLGAGKTVFVRGLAEGMGIDARDVHSPSFTIVSEYGPSASGRLLVHADLYRIESAGEVEELGLADSLSGDRVVAVEWGEKLPERLRRGAILVVLQDAGGDRRRLTVSFPAGTGPA